MKCTCTISYLYFQRLQQDTKSTPYAIYAPYAPNCHLIIHNKKEPFTIDEVREKKSGSTAVNKCFTRIAICPVGNRSVCSTLSIAEI